MPSLSDNRIAEPPAWWGTPAGQTLLAGEQEVIVSSLQGRPASPWLWLAPDSVAIGDDPPPRGLRLHRRDDAFAGPLQCRLPLPLPTEAFGSVIVQHVLDDGAFNELLMECARVLEPGGRLWLFALNPWSPYRAHWRKSAQRARDPRDWQARLRAAGLHLTGGEVRYLGPVWRAEPTPSQPPAVLAGLRAICLLEAESRVAGLIPPAPVQRRWNTGTAPA